MIFVSYCFPSIPLLSLFLFLTWGDVADGVVQRFATCPVYPCGLYMLDGFQRREINPHARHGVEQVELRPLVGSDKPPMREAKSRVPGRGRYRDMVGLAGGESAQRSLVGVTILVLR